MRSAMLDVFVSLQYVSRSYWQSESIFDDLRYGAKEK